ncbi:MAG: DUF4148 domain-containing protein [Burkholderiales bacterium]|nr:MAG: DUF4148 domain-containing protein [Burkholderiales bacterium]
MPASQRPLSTRRHRCSFRGAASGGNEEGDMRQRRTKMRRVQGCVSGLLLAVSATAWAGVEPYPEAITGPSVSTKTRAEVVAELHDAIRRGAMYDLPYMYADRVAFARASEAAGDARTTVEVTTGPDGLIVVWADGRLLQTKIRAETEEANRLGLVSFGEGDPPIATMEQEQSIAAAGRRAVEAMRVAQRAD